jgi:Fe-S-cluster-containing hydrogenase component 2
MRRLVVDAQLCAGCRQCEMVCSFHHSGAFNPLISRVTVIKDDKHGFDYPVFCRQCKDCPPAESCPSDAIRRTDEGITRVDGKSCIACGTCVRTCWFEAVKLGPDSKPVICDLCGGEPACISRCPTQAIRYTELEGFFEHPLEARQRLLKEWGIID